MTIWSIDCRSSRSLNELSNQETVMCKGFRHYFDSYPWLSLVRRQIGPKFILQHGNRRRALRVTKICLHQQHLPAHGMASTRLISTSQVSLGLHGFRLSWRESLNPQKSFGESSKVFGTTLTTQKRKSLKSSFFFFSFFLHFYEENEK